MRGALGPLFGVAQPESHDPALTAAAATAVRRKKSRRFNAGRTGRQVAAARARETQALENYRQLVRSAFVDVQDALSAQRTGAARREALADQADALADAYRLAQLRYDAGSSSYLEVLDAQRSLFRAQLDLVAAQSGELQAAVRLFQSLGGGFTAASQ